MAHEDGQTQEDSSELSRGSLKPFMLLPQRASNTSDHSTPKKCVRIVVVDDDRDTAAMMSTLLRMAGHEVEAAHDGAGALQAVSRFKPEVVLLDLGMPDIDGLEIARRLRRTPDGDKLLLIALTGHCRTDHVAAARAAGFDHHVAKPVDLNVVRRLVTQPAGSVARDP
jgi:two-component system, sensor histidine kinase